MRRLRLFLELIRFEHSIFALPFALIAAILSQLWMNARDATVAVPVNVPALSTPLLQTARGPIFPPVWTLAFIIIAMISGRTLAMLANRLIDAAIDAKNPRTANWHLPQGLLSPHQVVVWIVASAIIFLLSALALNLWCFLLAPLAAAYLILYPYAKRYTIWCHYVLGGAQAIAPVAVFLAVTGTISREILPLAAAVGLWVGSFDIYYALQDYEFDRAEGLRSLPVAFGKERAKLLALLIHLVSGALLIWTGFIFSLGVIFFIGTLVFTAVLIAEYFIVRHREDLVGFAFFTLNGIVSILYFGVALWAAAA